MSMVFGAADTVAQHAEEQAARGPAEQEDRRGVSGIRIVVGPGGSNSRMAGGRREDEELLVEAVEHPPKRSDNRTNQW